MGKIRPLRPVGGYKGNNKPPVKRHGPPPLPFGFGPKPPPIPLNPKGRNTPPPIPLKRKPEPPPLPNRRRDVAEIEPELIPPDRPFKRGRVGEDYWNARDKEVAVGDKRELGAPDIGGQFGDDTGVTKRIQETPISMQWIPGPPASHIHSMAMYDARNLLVMKTPLGEYIVDKPGNIPDSRIYVRFRPAEAGEHRTKRRGIERHLARDITMYVYFDHRHDYLKDIFGKMVDSNHPGEVVWQYLVDEIAYQRIY